MIAQLLSLIVQQDANPLSAGATFEYLIGLPMLFALLVILGMVQFYYGQRFWVQPKHNIHLAFRNFDLLRRRHDARMAKLKRMQAERDAAKQVDANAKQIVAISETDQESELDDGRLVIAEEDVRQERLMQADLESKQGIRKVPIHDAPLWMLAFLIVFLLSLILLVVDVSLGGDKEAFWLQKMVFGSIPFLRHLETYSRPLPAVITYVVIGYVALMLIGSLLAKILQIKQLHLYDEAHPRRRFIQNLWRICGIIENRKLDKSVQTWLIRPMLVLGLLLVAIDLLTVFGRIGPVWAGGLAMGHLFFISLVRVFDESWLYPISYTHKPVKIQSKTPLPLVTENILERGNLFPASAMLLARLEDNRVYEDAPDMELSHLLKDVLYAMSGSSRLWEQQMVGMQSTFKDKKPVVLCGPLGTGKSTWLRLVAIQEILQEAGGVLMVLPDRMRVRQEYQRINNYLRRSSVSWNITVFDAGTPEFMAMDICRHPPLLVLADLNSLDRVLLRHWNRFEKFWKTLTRVVIDDVDMLHGVQLSNAYYLVRRLLVIYESLNHADLQLCATASRISANLEDDLEQLLGKSITFVLADSGQRIPVWLYGIYVEEDIENEELETRKSFGFSREPSLIMKLGTEIRREGHDIYYDPRIVTRHEMEREHMMGSWAPLVRRVHNPLYSATSIVYVDHQNLFHILDDIRHYGAFSAEPIHVCYLLFSHNPIVQYQLTQLEMLLDKGAANVFGAFYFNHQNPILIQRHIEAALENMPLSKEQLERIFGGEITDRVLPDLLRDTRIERIEQAGHPFAGCFTLRNAAFDRSLDSDTIGGESISVVYSSKSGKAELFKGDAAYMRSTYFPGRTFIWHDERYVVTLPKLEDEQMSIIDVQAKEDESLCAKIRRIHVDYDSGLFERTASRCQAGGEAALKMAVLPVETTEILLGIRRFSSDLRMHSVVAYPDELVRKQLTISSNDSVLLIDFSEVNPDHTLLLALVRIWRAIAGSMFYGSFDLPDIIQPTDGSQSMDWVNMIGVRDLFPGGVGILRKHDDRQIFRYLALAREILLALPEIGRLSAIFDYSAVPLVWTDAITEQLVDMINRILPEAGNDYVQNLLNQEFTYGGENVEGAAALVSVLPAKKPDNYEMIEKVSGHIQDVLSRLRQQP